MRGKLTCAAQDSILNRRIEDKSSQLPKQKHFLVRRAGNRCPKLRQVVACSGLTPLAGREYELGVLRERWTQAQTGKGQVVLLSGEAGIGKSRLVQELTDQTSRRRRDPDCVSMFALSPEVMVCGLRGESHLTFSANWPSFSPIVADAQMGSHAALSLSPLRLLVCLEEDKGADHDVLAAGSVGGRGGVEAGSVERPARDGAVGD